MYNAACFKTGENEKSLTEGWRLSVSGNFSAGDNQPISDCTRRWMPDPRARKPTFVWSANDSMPLSLSLSLTRLRVFEMARSESAGGLIFLIIPKHRLLFQCLLFYIDAGVCARFLIFYNARARWCAINSFEIIRCHSIEPDLLFF